MEIIKKDDGTEVTAYSEEELQAQREAAIEEYKANNPDKSEELERLQAELAQKEEALGKEKEKEKNFGILKGALDKKEKEIVDLKVSIDKMITDTKKELVDKMMQGHYEKSLRDISGGDEELAKKIDFHYKRLSDPSTTEAEVEKKLKDAAVLAADRSEGVGSGAFSSGNVRPISSNNPQKLSEAETEVLAKIAEAGGMKIDINKYK